MNPKKFYIIFCTLLSAVVLTSGGDKQKSPPTAAANDPVCYAYRAEGKDREIKITSFYLTMRDGVRLAVSVYLPSNLKAGDKLPTILHQTRYWRSVNLRWPVSAIKSKFVDGYSRMIKKIALNGYAVVNVDVRGTGASFGNERIPFSQDQIKDGEEILNWIVQQKWSDSSIGLLGASYTGMAAEFLLANKHPSIKAVMSLYTGLDFYDEMLFPGGVYHQSFVKKYGEVGAMLDKNSFNLGTKLENFFIKGVSPVQKNGRRLLKQAVAEHASNFNIYDQTSKLNFRDDAPAASQVKSLDELSLHSRLEAINAANVPICLYTGWFDGSFALGSARLFNNLKGTQNKLIIGPWDHGSAYNCSPYVQQKCTFDRVAEILKFFDFHLKKKDNGLDKEAPVRYFTMGEDQWKTSKTWPPVGTVEKSFYFSANNQLSAQAQSEQAGCDTYIADTSAGTGNNTRSESLVFMLTSPKMYDARTERDKKLLCYNSLKLESDMEVTGHPIITLYIDADTSDAGFFVYLEDIDEAGEAHYITEGIFRAIYRNSQGNLGYKDIVPQYTYSKDAKAPLKRNEVAKIEFDLLPVSHEFKKGHSIRIAISCADKDHYKQITPAGAKINVHRNTVYASKIMLPVMPEAKSAQKP